MTVSANYRQLTTSESETMNQQTILNPIVEVSRNQAATMFQPIVSVRTLQRYLEIATIYLPTFKEFEDDETGGLNRFRKLTLEHIPVLQRMIDFSKSNGIRKLQIELSTNPNYFLLGKNNNGNYQGSSTIIKRSA